MKRMLVLVIICLASVLPMVVKADPLAQVIEGAKKERKVYTIMRAPLGPQAVKRLMREIRETYGVDLEITNTPNVAYGKSASDTIAMYKAGATPTYDLITLSKSNLALVIDSGAAQKVGWMPLLAPGTPPGVIRFDGYALTSCTDYVGLIYNPTVISPAEVPKTISDLTNPKWKGKFAMSSLPANWVDIAFARGIDRTLADLQAIMKNKPPLGNYDSTFNRYILGEVSMAMMSSTYLTLAKSKGVSAAWQSIEYSMLSQHCSLVLTGAQHPNAAKLVALYLASSKGAQLGLEEAGEGNSHYLGNPVHDILEQDQKQGLPTLEFEVWPGLRKFATSKAGDNLSKKISRIFLGG